MARRATASYRVRPAVKADLRAINDIYNHYVCHSACTYQEEPETMAQRRRWFQHHDARHPVIVAEWEGQVVGWGSLSAFHPRSAYGRTVENSVYVHHEHHRRGIGSALLRELLAQARAVGHHAVIAVIDSSQSGSLRLHGRFRFKKVGHFREVGRKFDRWLDVVYMELILRRPTPPLPNA